MIIPDDVVKGVNSRLQDVRRLLGEHRIKLKLEEDATFDQAVATVADVIDTLFVVIDENAIRKHAEESEPIN